MIPISKHKLNHSVSLFKTEIDEHLIHVRTEMNKWLNVKTYSLKGIKYELTAAQKIYLRYLRLRLDDLVFATPELLDSFLEYFDRIIPKKDRKRGSDFIPFKDKLIEVLGYETLRSHQTKALYPKFFGKLGIKVCVYCNSQLTITAEQSDKKMIARFQVDHFIDKSSYPCFSISFINLYPVCASCNNKKSRKNVGFRLYSRTDSQPSKSNYVFSLDNDSIAKFRLSKDEDVLKITFDDSDSKLNETFAVQGIYETQKDLAAELIIKSEVYNKSYEDSLRKSFRNLYGRGKAAINFNRFIVGNYTDPKDIHKRPMSKFTQDIARQIGLIKD